MRDSRLKKLEQQATLLGRDKNLEVPIVPDIVEFVESPRYLNLRGLFPRQWTILKLMCLQESLFTAFDMEVLDEWMTSFSRGLKNGVQPDVLDRMKQCQGEGRKYFREVVALIGRRGGKNYLGAIMAAYVIWHYLCKGNPQAEYGISEGQPLSFLVFAGNHLQAKAIQFEVIERVISGAPCFEPYLAGPSKGGQLNLLTPRDLDLAGDRTGIERSRLETIHVVAKQTTPLAGRGATSFAIVFDEMAHITASASSASAEDVYVPAMPSLDQFGIDAFIYEPSTPWQMTGQLYDNYLRSLERREDGMALHPEMLMLQLSSFDPYYDWERAHSIPVRPNGPFMTRKSRAIQSMDEAMQKEQTTNPEAFNVERRSQWAPVQAAYLRVEHITGMFEAWDGRTLYMQDEGIFTVNYRAHADPARTGDNFSLAIAHGEVRDGVVHVVFDHLAVWKPSEFPGRVINFVHLKEALRGYIERFRPTQFSFDHWNTASFIDELDEFTRTSPLLRSVSVLELRPTAARNWDRAETFKTALAERRIHAPYKDEGGSVYPASQLLEQELRFLQNRGGRVDHPTSGPVTTKDLADAAMECVVAIIGDEGSGRIEHYLSGLTPSGSFPAGGYGRPEIDSSIAAAFSELGGRRRDPTSAARGGRFR